MTGVAFVVTVGETLGGNVGGASGRRSLAEQLAKSLLGTGTMNHLPADVMETLTNLRR